MISVLLLLLAALTVTSCTKQPEIEQPDEALLAQVKKDYYYFRFGEDYNPEIDGEITTVLYYGLYNDYAVVLFEGTWQVFTATREEKIAGYDFQFANYGMIYLWKDGAFFALTEAYEQNLLTKKQIASISKIHENRLFLVYD